MRRATETADSERGAVVRRRQDAKWWAVASERHRLREVLHTALRTVRQVVGAPDYARYLEHHAACHPDRAPLTEREFYVQFLSWRYAGGASRCC